MRRTHGGLAGFVVWMVAAVSPWPLPASDAEDSGGPPLVALWREMQILEDEIEQGDVAGAVESAQRAVDLYGELRPLVKGAIRRLHPETEAKMENLVAEAAELAALRAAEMATASYEQVSGSGYASGASTIVIPPANVTVTWAEGAVPTEGTVKVETATGQTYLYYGAAWIQVSGTYATSGYTYYAAEATASATSGYVYVPAASGVAPATVYYTPYSAVGEDAAAAAGATGPAGGTVEGQGVAVYAVGEDAAAAAGVTTATVTTPSGEEKTVWAVGGAAIYQTEDGTVKTAAGGAVAGENGVAAGATSGETSKNESGGVTHESQQAGGAATGSGAVGGTREASTSTDGQGNMQHESTTKVQDTQGNEVEVEHSGEVEGAGTGSAQYSGSTDVTKNGQTASTSTEAGRGEGVTREATDSSGNTYQRQSPKASGLEGSGGGSGSNQASRQAPTTQRRTTPQPSTQERARMKSDADQARHSAQKGSQDPFAGSGEGLGTRQTSPQTQQHFQNSSGGRGSSGGGRQKGGGGRKGR